MIRDKYETFDEFVRELVRTALWDVAYYGSELAKTSKQIKIAKKLVTDAGFDFQAMMNEKSEADLYEDDFESIESLCHALVRDRIDNIESREVGLKTAHQFLSMIKILLTRIDVVVDFNAIQREVEADLEEKS